MPVHAYEVASALLGTLPVTLVRAPDEILADELRRHALWVAAIHKFGASLILVGAPSDKPYGPLYGLLDEYGFDVEAAPWARWVLVERD